jgi:hypothetical protein
MSLNVKIVPNVLYTCCILYNLTIRRRGMEFEELMRYMNQDVWTEVELQ